MLEEGLLSGMRAARIDKTKHGDEQHRCSSRDLVQFSFPML